MAKPITMLSVSKILDEHREYLKECEREIEENSLRVEHYKADKAITERKIKALEDFLFADKQPLPPAPDIAENPRRKMTLKDRVPDDELLAVKESGLCEPGDVI